MRLVPYMFIHGRRMMLDRDLAGFVGVETIFQAILRHSLKARSTDSRP